MKTIEDRVKDVAKKIAEREARKQAVTEKYKTDRGKKLTVEQRIDRIEEMLGIAD